MTWDRIDRAGDEALSRRTGPTKKQMEEDLRRAVINTGGTAVKAAPPPEPAPPAPPSQMRMVSGPRQPAPPATRQRKHEDLKAEGARRIDASALTPVKATSEIGPRPKLLWLPLRRLYVDDRYQRNVLERGLANVYRIAREFDWNKFSPVIAAQVDDRYAIVDGQHRCYAAALRDLDEVPCLVIQASLAEQAATFAAINGRITRLSDLHLHAAAVTAGDAGAVSLDAVCRAARVEICRYPVPENKMKPRETLAIGTLRQCLKMHGERVLRLALSCIVAAHPDAAGVLRAPLIRAMCEVCAGIPPGRNDALIEAAGDFDFTSEMAAAKTRAAQSGQALWRELQESLIAEFDPPDGDA